MYIPNEEETLDLLYEVEKWYEGTDNKDDWISCFTNKNKDESLLELDDYILNETSDTSSQISSLSICNTRINRCLIDDFEMLTPDFDWDTPLLCSTPLSRNADEMEELRMTKHSVAEDKMLQDLFHPETIKLLEVYPSFFSSSVDTVSLTELNIEKTIPELEYTSCSSLDIIDLPSHLAICDEDTPIISKEHHLKYTNKNYLLLKSEYPLHNLLSLSNFEMSI